jgi:enoyl-CoA hydratase/carnithine racemase
VRELAARIAANPGRTLRITKRLIRDSSLLSLDNHLEMAGAFQSIVHETEDHVEALDAVLQKRKPTFRNV